MRSVPSQREALVKALGLISTRAVLEGKVNNYYAPVNLFNLQFYRFVSQSISLLILLVFLLSAPRFVLVDFLQHKSILDICNISIQHLPLKLVKSLQ